MKKTKIQLENRECYLYSTENPEFVLIQPVDEHDIAVLDNEVSQIEKSGMKFILSAFRVNDWNNELTAWNAPQAFGNACFGSKAGETLQYITENLIPEVKKLSLMRKNIFWADILSQDYSAFGVHIRRIFSAEFRQYRHLYG